MKYKYNTVMGNLEVEVDERFRSVLQAMDREEYNSNRKYHRHSPISLSNADYDGEWMEDASDIPGDLVHAEDRTQLCAALAKLTLDQQDLLYRVFLNDEKIADIARKAGVTEGAIRDRLRKIYKRLKKVLL